MEQKELLQRLKEARQAIDAAVAWVSKQRDTAPVERAADTGQVCLFCGKPILTDDQVVRGVHRVPCYNTMKTMDRNGTKKFEKWAEEGKIGPPQAPGRKKTVVAQDAMNYRKLVEKPQSSRKADRKPSG